jgi:hypothetical protein
MSTQLTLVQNKLKSEYGALSGTIKDSNSTTFANSKAGSGGGANGTPKKASKSANGTPAMGGSRKRGAKRDDVGVNGHGLGGSELDDEEESPTKKVKMVKVKEEVVGGEDDAEGVDDTFTW